MISRAGSILLIPFILNMKTKERPEIKNLMLNQQCCCGWRFRHTTIVLDAKSCMLSVGFGIFMADFSVCVCALVARRKWWIQHKICCRCVSLTRYETLNSSLSDNNALAREKRRKKNEPEENAMQQQQQQLRTKKVHHGGGSSPATNEEAEEESTMKTRAMKSLCKQAQNECRVVIAGALLILPKDLVLIVRFAGLVSRLLSHSLRSSA